MSNAERLSRISSNGLDLDCGCRLNGRHGEGELPHEKTPPVLASWVDFFIHFKYFTPKRVLEIGVKKGGSLVLWNTVLKCEVVGVDKEDSLAPGVMTHLAKHYQYAPVTTHLIKAPSPKLAELGTFDMVIDDGSHEYGDILSSFEILWPKVLDAGFYIIEDWRTDAGHPWMLLWDLAKRMIGYWPDPTPPSGCCEKGVPHNILIWRDMIAIHKGPHEGSD